MKKVFTIYDVKAEAYLDPFMFGSRGLAIRAFSDSLKDPNSQMARYPEDFTLMELGSFDEFKCLYEIHLVPVPIGTGLDFINTNPS